MISQFRTFLLEPNALALAISRSLIREAPAAAVKDCSFCREANALNATKCRACASLI